MFTYQGYESERVGMVIRWVASLGFKSQIAVVLAFYVGLFVLEYPPIFLLGYWSWGALVHKTITGILLAVNLVITQQAARRSGMFGSAGKQDGRAVEL